MYIKLFTLSISFVMMHVAMVHAAQPYGYNMSLFTSLSSAQSAAIGGESNLFITEGGGIKKFALPSTSGTIITTNVSNPSAVATDVANVYVSDSSNRILLLTPSSNGTYVQTVIATNETAATTTFTYSPNALYSANIGTIRGIAVDANHNIYLSDSTKHVIWKLTPPASTTGKYTLTLFAGVNGTSGTPTTGTTTKFNTPYGITFDPWGNLYVADLENRVIQKITLSTTGAITNISVVAGQAKQYAGNNDGQAATSACLYLPKAVVFDQTGSFYISNAYVDVVQYVSAATGTIKVIAGGKSPSNNATSYNGIATGANFLGIGSIALDAKGNLYVTELNNSAVRKLTPTWHP